MKTSNKILLGAISVLGLSMLSILVFAKSSLISIDHDKIQGNGKIIKLDYPIEDISMLDVDEFFEVYIRKGEPKLEIEADENIQALLRANFDNYHRSNENEAYKRVLKVGKMNNARLNPTQAIKLFLAVPSLEGIHIDNHASVIFEEVMTSEKFDLEAEEFSTVDLKIDTKDLKVNADNHATINIDGNIGETQITADEFSSIEIKNINAGEVSLDLRNHVQVKLAGTTNTLKIDSDEFCEIDVAHLIAQTGDIYTRNHSNLYLYVTDNLKVKANEFTNIKYRGNPTIEQYLDKTSTLEKVE